MRTVAAITGASSGIGKAFAHRLAAKHDLLLIARRLDRLQEVGRELESKFQTKVQILAADLAVEADADAVAAHLRNEMRLGFLVNNAGFGTRGRFWETAFDAQEQMHKLHVTAVVKLTRAALETMTKRNEGAIVNVASVAGFFRSPGSVSYCATKSWMNAFTEALYLELAGIDSKITVQALCPGYTHSEFHDVAGLNRERLAGKAFWLTAEEVVDASLAGLSRRKLFVVPGWRYAWLIALMTKFPVSWRLAIERKAGKRRIKQ